MQRGVKGFLLLAAFLLGGCVTISLWPGIEPLEEAVVEGKGKEKILLLDLSGVLSEEPRGREPNLVARIKEELLKAEKDKHLRAVVIRINSPGGTVTASDLIHHEIMQFKKKKGIKVIASIGEVGASGAYYVAMAADQVVAHPTAITGSIGVLMLHLNVHGLLEKVGIEAEAIKSGPHKDIGSPFREMSVKDRQILQEMINEMQKRFLEVVVQGRGGMNAEEVQAISDGRIFTAVEAKQLNLIDQIGHLDHAILVAKQEAGLAEAKVIVYRRPSQYIHNIYSQEISLNPSLSAEIFLQPSPSAWEQWRWKADLADLVRGQPARFFYLWMP